jgi:Tfp pilus assembly protein PilF
LQLNKYLLKNYFFEQQIILIPDYKKLNTMKKYFSLSILCLLTASILVAQPGKKQKKKEKPPTQKELQDMMKEMQAGMPEMSAEDKKVMDSMGIKMPDFNGLQKNIGSLSNAQIKKAYEDDNRIVPLKDAARINAALATTISNAEMSAYIDKTHQSVQNKLSANAKTNAKEILQQLTQLKTSVANTAVGFWIDGKPTLALYLMGEACKSYPIDADNLNNYASFLTTCGAEQLALPILNNLNKNFPDNETILNNISQAWLGLGDITRAEKYADSAIRIYAYHPQANMAKCLIEESKGNIPKAIEAAKKSIAKAYSQDKENKLKKLGYILKPEDLDWNRPMPQDPTGLAKFSWPEYPLSVNETKDLKIIWGQFTQLCNEQLAQLSDKQKKAEEAWKAGYEYRMKAVMNGATKGKYVQLIPGYAAKAIKKLGYTVEGYEAHTGFVFSDIMEKVKEAGIKAEEYQATLEKEQGELDKKYKNKLGEGGTEEIWQSYCGAQNTIRNNFLVAANGGLQAANNTFLNNTRRRIDALLYYDQYTMWPEQFELMKVLAQSAWLTILRDRGVYFIDRSIYCKPDPNKSINTKLSNFDDMHCQYVSTMNFGVYKITSSCSNLVGEFDFGGVKINVSDNVETGKYSGTVIVGVSKSIKGPMGVGVKATAGGIVEIDNSGITDVGVIGGVTVKEGPISIGGIEVKSTVNTGTGISGKGILKGIK